MGDAGLRAAADRIEIHELLNRYAFGIDNWDWDVLRRVFTADAVVDFSSMGRYVEGESTVEGIESIIAWYEGALEKFRGVLHFMTNHMVDLDGDRARATCLMQVLHLPMGGVYRADCVRTSSGWRIRRLALDETRFEDAAGRLERHMASVDEA